MRNITINRLLIVIIISLSISCDNENPAEPLASTLSPAPVTDISAWSVTPGDFEHLMTIVAVIHLQGEPECSAENKLAAFIGNDVRGIASSYQHQDCVNYNLIVYSNTLDDSVTFGVYLAARDTAVAATNKIIFSANSGTGTPDAPYVVEVGE